MHPKKKILVIDDDSAMGEMLKDYFSSSSIEVLTYTSAEHGLQYLKSLDPFDLSLVDLVITDLKMPGIDGITFIENFKRLYVDIPIILMTAFGSIETAIEATKKGAFFYLVKPFKLEDVRLIVDRALQYKNLVKENLNLKSQFRQQNSFAGIIGKSAPMQAIFDLIQRVAPSNSNILIHGESGTGKELVAKAIHKFSHRSKGPFVAINCTAIPETLLESELFGHAKGSFTGAVAKKTGLFEEANGGTIFLDEIGDMAMSLQAKILRVIQERKVRAVGDNIDRAIDVRIIAASHKDLKSAIKDQLFREDLYYRLSVIPILLPPLRHRAEDIPLLAYGFLDKYNTLNGKQISGITEAAIQQLMNLPWEGNVRELENVIERAVVLCNSDKLESYDLPKTDNVHPEALFAQLSKELPTLENFEKRYIQFILTKVGGKKEKASHILGINRRTLYRKEREYGWIENDPQFDEEHD